MQVSAQCVGCAGKHSRQRRIPVYILCAVSVCVGKKYFKKRRTL